MNRDHLHVQQHTDTAIQRPYRAPHLLVYGAMSELTANGSKNVTEGTGKDQNPMGRL